MSEFSEFDELRSMFEDLSGQPPLVLGRKEAVMLKISRRNQRLVAVRSVAAFGIAAALGLGVVTTTQHFQNTGDEGAQQSVVTEPSHSATPSHEPTDGRTPGPSTEPTHAPAVEPTHAPVVEPTHAPAVLPAHAPTQTATENHPTTVPSPENTAASGPLTVDLSMSPSTVDTSNDTHALVTARDGEGRLLAVDITWGDGTTLHFSPTGQAACPRTTHLDGSFNHRYTSAGSYVVHVTVTTGDCAAQEQVTREGHVTVTGTEPSSPPSPEATATNGPAAPVASGGTRSGDNAAYVYITAAGKDADGWIRSIVVHWGDGAESSYQYDTSACTQASGTNHPVSNQQTSGVPGGHKYASSGDKTVTVTTTSTACDGSGPQSGSTTFTVSAP